MDRAYPSQAVLPGIGRVRRRYAPLLRMSTGGWPGLQPSLCLLTFSLAEVPVTSHWSTEHDDTVTRCSPQFDAVDGHMPDSPAGSLHSPPAGQECCSSATPAHWSAISPARVKGFAQYLRRRTTPDLQRGKDVFVLHQPSLSDENLARPIDVGQLPVADLRVFASGGRHRLPFRSHPTGHRQPAVCAGRFQSQREGPNDVLGGRDGNFGPLEDDLSSGSPGTGECRYGAVTESTSWRLSTLIAFRRWASLIAFKLRSRCTAHVRLRQVQGGSQEAT